MSTDTTPPMTADGVTTPYDVLVVGGGAAGLSAALTLSRARRRVMVIDAGQPRNAPASAVHGLLGHEGISPVELLARGRTEVQRFGGELRSGSVEEVRTTPAGFSARLADGSEVEGRRLLIATGLVDELPDVPGVREQWGVGVVHCPYCHGWEIQDRHIGVLATGPMSVHQALLFSQWSSQVTLFAAAIEMTEPDLALVAAAGIEVVSGAIDSVVSDHDGVHSVRLADGTDHRVEAVAVASRMLARIAPFAALGVHATDHPLGQFLEADATGRTGVPGIWAAGNVSNLSAQVGAAAAEGAWAAAQINADLLFADLDARVRPA